MVSDSKWPLQIAGTPVRSDGLADSVSSHVKKKVECVRAAAKEGAGVLDFDDVEASSGFFC